MRVEGEREDSSGGSYERTGVARMKEKVQRPSGLVQFFSIKIIRISRKAEEEVWTVHPDWSGELLDNEFFAKNERPALWGRKEQQRAGKVEKLNFGARKWEPVRSGRECVGGKSVRQTSIQIIRQEPLLNVLC